MRTDLKKLGELCKRYRESLNILQKQVAEETEYSKETVSAFETGRNNNAAVFAWYVKKGVANNEEIKNI